MVTVAAKAPRQVIAEAERGPFNSASLMKAHVMSQGACDMLTACLILSKTHADSQRRSEANRLQRDSGAVFLRPRVSAACCLKRELATCEGEASRTTWYANALSDTGTPG
jgi:hypothetical protein